MNNVTLRETSYSNCGQKAWAVEHENNVLFYLVRGGGFLWSARESLGRGYVSGSMEVPFGVWEIRAKLLGTAKRKVFSKLADALREKADHLGDCADLLDSGAK